VFNVECWVQGTGYKSVECLMLSVEYSVQRTKVL